MHPLTRRSLALIATAATLGAGSLTTAAQASAATSIPGGGAGANAPRGLLSGVLGLVLALIGVNSTPSTIQGLISTYGLDTSDLGSLLSADGASTGQVNALLGGLTTTQLTSVVANLTSTGGLGGVLGKLTPASTGTLLAPLTGSTLTSTLGLLSTAQLTGALATLNPTQISGLLAAASDPTSLLGALSTAQITSALGLLNTTQLTSVVGALTPTQISGLLGSPSAPTSIVTGLLGKATGIAGGTPGAAAVDGLLAQVQALLGGGLPTVPGTDSLLTTVTSLAGVSGVDTSALSSLLATAQAALAASGGGPASAPLQGLVGTLTTLLAGPTPPAGTPPGTTTTKPGATTVRPAVAQLSSTARTAPAAISAVAYRGRVTSIKVAKNRRSAKVTVSCPAIAPKGCVMKLKGVVARRKAFAGKQIIVLRGKHKTVTTKLTSATSKRLKHKGGSLKVSATTLFSTLATISKTVRVARAH